MIKLRWLFEISEPEENLKFKSKFPKIKPKPIPMNSDIKNALLKWKDEPTNNQPKDQKTIQYWTRYLWKQIPPIIIADYGSGIKILDGRHRAYANFIVNNEPFIYALIEPKKNL